MLSLTRDGLCHRSVPAIVACMHGVHCPVNPSITSDQAHAIPADSTPAPPKGADGKLSLSGAGEIEFTSSWIQWSRGFQWPYIGPLVSPPTDQLSILPSGPGRVGFRVLLDLVAFKTILQNAHHARHRNEKRCIQHGGWPRRRHGAAVQYRNPITLYHIHDGFLRFACVREALRPQRIHSGRL